MNFRSLRVSAFVSTAFPTTASILLAALVACGGATPSPAKPIDLVAGEAKVTSTPAVVVGAAPSAAWSDADSKVPVTSLDPSWGNRNAPVTVVVFSDFQCPFCSKLDATLDKITTTYGPDKVRLIWKNEPLEFHANARPAAEAAQGVFELAGNDAFWRFRSLAFAHQRDLSAKAYSGWAREAGVRDIAAFERGLDEDRWASKIDEDHAIAKKIGVNGTPASYINGIELSGSVPVEQFAAIIDAQLEAAAAKRAGGTAADRMYVELSSDNFRAPKARRADDNEKDDTVRHRVAIGNAPTLGPANAPVTLVLFSDFQCPFCKRVEETLTQVRAKYAGKIRIVWKNEPLPFHPRAIPAANLALYALRKQGEAGFWRAHDALFASQGHLEDSDLEAVATALQLDLPGVRNAIQRNAFRAQIEQDADEAEDLDAAGTPHMFINGRRLVGAQPLAKFVEVIDEALKEAAAKVAAGTPAARVYDALMSDAVAVKPPSVSAYPPPAVPAGAYSRGPANAKVTIQLFSDFQCPFCARVEPTIEEILKNYPSQVRVVWRDRPLPMHPDAPLAAEAAREAGAQRGAAGFWQMHKLLFANQQQLSRSDLDGYAAQLNLNAARFAAALDKHTHQAAVDADGAAGAAANINGAPGAFVGPYFVSGAQPYRKFRRVIELVLHPPAPAPAPAAVTARP